MRESAHKKIEICWRKR